MTYEQLPKDIWSWDLDANVYRKYENFDEAAITDLLMGKKVEKVNEDHLVLSDGTILRIVPNEGCGGCANGWYELSNLQGCDNIITAVDFDYEENESEKGHYGNSVYSIFVYAEDKRFDLLKIEGSDGNGYYGTGYKIIVKLP